MHFLLDFFRKKAPRSGGEIPLYYRNALVIIQALLSFYFLASLFLFYWGTGRWEWLPALLMAVTLGSAFYIGRIPLRLSLFVYVSAIFLWCGWYVRQYGWGCGGQHFLVPVIIMLFFNIYDPPWMKIVTFAITLAYRMLLFSYSINNEPIFALERGTAIAFQTVNSLMFFIMMACLCILFSSNIQETERKLRLDNQELHREAGTDPLTQLPNRRDMVTVIDRFQQASPGENFCVAIADIDFFKKVNDTYGHNCGDYTLRQLADLFRAHAGERYSVCRWGGEEFCFFLPMKNLDEAGGIMLDICNKVRHMALAFEGNEFKITITIGVEENDFNSPLSAILEKADQKLYMGKESGRDRVVV